MKSTHEGAGRNGWRTILGVLLLAAAPTALAGPYTFVNIADNTGPYQNFLGGGISLNAGGTVAFTAPLKAGGSGIFTGSGGAVTTVVDTSSSPFSAFGAGTAINNTGTVAFRGTLDVGGSGIFSTSGGIATTIAETGDRFSALGPHVAINNGGTVAFLGDLTLGGSGAFAGNGGSLLTLADTSGPLADFLLAKEPGISLNDAGTAAFVARLDPPGGVGVFSGKGGAVTTVFATPGTGFTSVGSHPAIGDDGKVAFVALNDGGTPLDCKDDTAALYRWSGGSLTTIVDTSGKFMCFGVADIDADGTVLFLGVLDTGGFGYYTSDDLVNPVISFGDTLFGARVTGLDSLPSFNDAGQIAFTYEIVGRRGIARADLLLADVPAPATLALLGIGLAGLGCARRASVKR